MSERITDPLLLVALAACVTGTILLVQAHVQARLLRGRIARGDGSLVMDPATGLYSAASAWQCIRAEANRSARLGRPLHIWVGAAPDAAVLDEQGKALVFDMPAGATGIRIDRQHLCVVSCAGEPASPTGLLESMEWRSRSIEPGEDSATSALAFVSEGPLHG